MRKFIVLLALVFLAGEPDAGVTCGPGSCGGCCDSTGHCRAGTENGACGLSGASCSDCREAVCVTGPCETPVEPLEGDACLKPIELLLDSAGFASVALDLTGLADDTRSSCGPGGADAVVSFDVPEDGTYVELVVRSEEDGVRPSVSLRGACDQPGSESQCGLAPVGVRSARVATYASRGRLFAWVEAAGTPHSPLRLELRLTPPVPGNTCAAPHTLELQGGSVTRRDDLRRYAPDGLSCIEGARDAVYTFRLPYPAQVTASVSSLTAGFEPSLTVSRGSCASPGCTASGLETSSFNGLLFAGTHSIIVSSKDLSAGEFELSVAARPPPTGETCSEAVELSFDSTGYGSAWVETMNRSDDFTLGCRNGASGPDSVFRFRVDRTSDFSASLSGGWYGGVFALRSACDGADLGCGSVLSVADLAPGEYFLLTDASSFETSRLSLSARLTEPRAQGETCARPMPISLAPGRAGGTARVTGTLSGAWDDIPEHCGSFSSGASEHVYSVTIDRPLVVEARAARTGTSGTVAVRLVNPTNCGLGFSMACQAGTSATVRDLLPAGTYFLVVESSTGLGYTLDVSAQPAPEGESCDNPIVFDFPAGGGTRTHQATTRGSSQQNYNSACMGDSVPDRVYALTLTDPASNLRVTSKARGSTNAPALLLMDQCIASVPRAESCDSALTTRVLQQTALPAGTYFLWLKGPTVDGTDYDLEVSVTPTRPGDTCSVATTVPLSEGLAGGTATLEGTTVGMSDDLYACGQTSPSFPDYLYSVTIDRELDVKVKMTPRQTPASGVVMLTDATCNRWGRGLCSRSDASGVATLRAGSLQAGTHYFSVDHSSGGPGAYSLEVSALPHQPGETCSLPLPLTFSGGATGGTAVASIDPRDFFDDPSVDCYGGGADAFFSFTIDRVLDLYVDVERPAGTGIPKLGLFTGCSGPVSCESIYSTSDSFARGSLQPGTYVLAVDFDDYQPEGPLTMQASLTPPTPGDTCAVAIPLGFPEEGGTAEATGSFVDAFDDHRDDCATSYEERVYTFTTTRTMNLIAQASTVSGAKAPTLTLRSSACEGSSVACTYGGTSQSFLRVKDLPAGTYYLFIERSTYDAPSDYALKVSLGERPAGDQCTNALALGLPASGSGQVTVQGDTRPFFHDLTPSCGASSGTRNAPETVYTFTTTTPTNLRLSVKALTTGFRPTVALRRGCGSTDSDLRCAGTPTYSPDTWTSYRELPAGTYYVVVDGYDATQAGAFELTARLSAAGLAGESCTNPEPVTLSQGTHGRATLTRGFPDFFEDHSDCWNSSGSDVVFAVTTDRPRRLHARATGSPSQTQPTVSVRKGPCDQSSSQLACERSSFDGTSRVSADLPSGTSYIIVKSPLTNPAGTFQLDVEVDDFEPGDVCAGAIPLVLSGGAAGGTASATVEPYTFGSDLKLTCDTSNTPDAFFTFTTDRTLNLSATLQRQNTSGAFSVGLLAGCGGTESVCRTTGFSSAPLTLTKSALPAGTHVLVVRGGTAQPAGLTLDVSLTP